MSEPPFWMVWLPTVAAGLQLLQVPCMSSARRSFDWDRELASLSPLARQVVVLFGGGITACIFGLSIVVLVGHGELGASRLGLALSAFLALFWCGRATLQLTWLAPSFRSVLPTHHRLLVLLYPYIGLSYLVFFVMSCGALS